MEKINFLGTGSAMTLDCYNTCFTIQNNNDEHILVDTGGGLQILKQLRDCNIDCFKIHNIILSHKHTDHILGMFWIIRYYKGLFDTNNYEGKLNVYMHKELENSIRNVMFEILPKKFTDLIDNKIIFNIVKDGETIKILNYDIEFFDINSKKEKQFGFKTKLENKKNIVFLGDETFKEELREKTENADWLLHEAFCLDSEADLFRPYEKKHSTVKTAAQIAQSLKVKNLILYHSSDNYLKERKKLYTQEAQKYFNGSIYVPNDLDIIEL